MQDLDDGILTVSIKETERLTGLGRNTIFDLLADGRLRSAKIGARRLIIAASIREMIKKAEVVPFSETKRENRRQKWRLGKSAPKSNAR